MDYHLHHHHHYRHHHHNHHNHHDHEHLVNHSCPAWIIISVAVGQSTSSVDLVANVAEKIVMTMIIIMIVMKVRMMMMLMMSLFITCKPFQQREACCSLHKKIHPHTPSSQREIEIINFQS